MADDLAAWLDTEARRLGFDVVGLARADETWAASERLEAFVEAGYHGSMTWIQETLERRKMPTSMWPEAKSAIVVGMNYGPDIDPLAVLDRPDLAGVSVYAKGSDYHDVLKKRLKHLARGFVEQSGQQVKVFVDTAPLMEKPLAAKAGLGWQGKHTNLVSRAFGSWLFLGVMLTDAVLPADAEEIDHCGSCRACLDICPTDAFPGPYRLDARRCIAYLTIEHHGPIPHEFRHQIGNRIYGCDDCLAVCPWNKFAVQSREQALWARLELQYLKLADLLELDDAAFRTLFSGSPIKRIGRNRFVRNVLIGIGNSGDRQFLNETFFACLTDPDATVRATAIWALRCLDENRFGLEKRKRMPHETDPVVIAEWRSAAGPEK